MKKIFICSRYAGDVTRNVVVAERLCRKAVEQGCAPFAPHLLFTRFLDDEKASEREIEAARRGVERAASEMGRRMEIGGLKDLLYVNYEHPRWDDVAARCLSCGNCTLACPTCFCTTIEDVTDLTGDTAERVRRWDSCFNVQYAYVHGGSTRTSTRARYRQWMTHKLATWRSPTSRGRWRWPMPISAWPSPEGFGRARSVSGRTATATASSTTAGTAAGCTRPGPGSVVPGRSGAPSSTPPSAGPRRPNAAPA